MVENFTSNIPRYLSKKKLQENYFSDFYDQPGTEPGTLLIASKAQPSKIILINYDQNNAIRKIDLTPNECISYLDKNTISWFDIQGLGSENVLQEIAQIFKLHPLLLADVVNVPQPPKIELYKNYLLIIAQMVRSKEKGYGFKREQVGFVLGKGYLLTFQEDQITDSFDIVREKIKKNQGKVRQLGVDYLIYLLLDSLIAEFFPVVEKYEKRMEIIEEKIILNPQRKLIEELYYIRRELLALRRLILPLQVVLNTLIKDDSGLISADVQVYLRDCYVHAVQITDIIETYRELASGLMDVYQSSLGNRMNEIMKFLTVIATIFNPLTFIAGIYGMNFEYMPELQLKWGYFACLGLMGAIACGSISYFWRQGWFRPLDDPENKR